MTVLEITVYRGLSEDGLSVIGQIDRVATANYYFVPGTATSDRDYHGENGSIAFTPGSDSELFIRHCLPNNRMAQIFIIDVRRLPLRQLIVTDIGAT